MKKSRYSDSQIMAILRQGEAGTPVPELCREHGIPSLPLNQCRDLTVIRTDYQVTFPMSWNGTIFDSCRALTDRYAINDMTSSPWRMRLRVPELSLSTQMLA